MSDETFARFRMETEGMADPPNEPPPGEVIPPGGTVEEAFNVPLEMFITEEIVAAFFALPGNMMARKTGHEWWRPEEEEKEILGKGCTPGIRYLVAKYLTQGAGPLVGLAAALSVVYGPKVVREQIERRREQESQQPPRQTSPVGSAASSGREEAESPQNSSEWSGVTSAL